MKTTEQRIEEIKSNGYDLDFGTVFNDAFENWKKTALMSGLATLVFGIVIFGLALGAIAVMGGFAAYSQFALDMATDEFSLLGTVVYCLSICLIAGLSNPFTAGLIKMAHQADNGEEVSVGDAFQCYKQPYFLPLFIEAFLISLFTIFITTFLQRAFPSSLGISFMGSIFNLFVTFMAMMAVPLIIFGNLKPIEAIRGSFIVVSKNFWVLLGLVIVAYLLACAGLIAFCIGILFTTPFVYSVYFTIYKQSVGLSEKSEIDEIGTDEQF